MKQERQLRQVLRLMRLVRQAMDLGAIEAAKEALRGVRVLLERLKEET